jgi:hypothetical protein
MVRYGAGQGKIRRHAPRGARGVFHRQFGQNGGNRGASLTGSTSRASWGRHTIRRGRRTVGRRVWHNGRETRSGKPVCHTAPRARVTYLDPAFELPYGPATARSHQRPDRRQTRVATPCIPKDFPCVHGGVHRRDNAGASLRADSSGGYDARWPGRKPSPPNPWPCWAPFVARLQRAHGRKYGFWGLVEPQGQ